MAILEKDEVVQELVKLGQFYYDHSKMRDALQVYMCTQELEIMDALEVRPDITKPSESYIEAFEALTRKEALAAYVAGMYDALEKFNEIERERRLS